MRGQRRLGMVVCRGAHIQPACRTLALDGTISWGLSQPSVYLVGGTRAGRPFKSSWWLRREHSETTPGFGQRLGRKKGVGGHKAF